MSYSNQFKSIILGLILAFGISVASAAWTAPSNSAPNNGTVAAPIDTSASEQAKAGTLAIGSTATATSPYKLDVLGYILSTGLAVSGGADVQGNIKADTLASTGSQKVCADATGVLILCGPDELSVTYENMNSESTFIVPSNTGPTMTVEIWGGGGGSYGNSSADGGDSYFYYTSVANKITAGGGKKGAVTTGGVGGTIIAPPASRYTYVTQTNGGSGGNGGTKISPIQDITCSNIWTGNTGGMGGSGGASNGIGVIGPAGGSPGSLNGVICGGFTTNTASPYGNDGISATTPGTGGAGFSGKGGDSGNVPPTTTTNGSDGSGGGGGGAYVKVTVNVTPLETYQFKAGYFGQGTNQWTGGGSAPNGWPEAGDGGSGRVKITYTVQ